MPGEIIELADGGFCLELAFEYAYPSESHVNCEVLRFGCVEEFIEQTTKEFIESRRVANGAEKAFFQNMYIRGRSRGNQHHVEFRFGYPKPFEMEGHIFIEGDI